MRLGKVAHDRGNRPRRAIGGCPPRSAAQSRSLVVVIARRGRRPESSATHQSFVVVGGRAEIVGQWLRS